MYAPKQFREERPDVLIAAMRSIQFGTLVAPFEAEVEAVHLPMVLRESPEGVVLEGHVAVGKPR